MNKFPDTEEERIAKIIVDFAYHIHVNVGPGLLESAYQAMLAHDLRKRGLKVVEQYPVPLRYDGIVLDDVSYRADIMVNDLVMVELKSVEEMHPVFFKQLLTYLRLTDTHLGLLINFGMYRFKDGMKRILNGY